MKVIDLYYKIVMKEELPKQVKYKNKVYYYDDEIDLNPYVSREGTYSEYLIGATIFQCPTDEIEIIEEEKEIEELPKTTVMHQEPSSLHIKMEYKQSKEEICDKINELAREVNKLKNKERINKG